MTCIAALIQDGVITMGGDSAGVGGYDLHLRADPKVFRNGDFLIGYTTSFRMGQLLRFKFKPPEHPRVSETGAWMDAYEYMVKYFVEEVRKCLKDGGFAHKENEVEKGGCFLAGYRGRLFYVDSDYQVGELLDPFSAVGCGASIALGALYASEGLPPAVRINRALEAAERFSAGVRRPFVIEQLETKI